MDAGSEFVLQLEHVIIISVVNLAISLLAVARTRLEAFKKAQQALDLAQSAHDKIDAQS